MSLQDNVAQRPNTPVKQPQMPVGGSTALAARRTGQ